MKAATGGSGGGSWMLIASAIEMKMRKNGSLAIESFMVDFFLQVVCFEESNCDLRVRENCCLFFVVLLVAGIGIGWIIFTCSEV